MRDRLLGLVAVLALVGCAATKDCTAIGCINAITVVAPTSLVAPSSGVLTVCLGEECKKTAFADEGDQPTASVQFDQMKPGQVASAELVMPDGSRYEAAAELESSRPNGPGCDPVCVQAELPLTISPTETG